MTNNRNSVRSFGPGYDWEEGAYPTPSESVRDYIEDERKDGVPNQAPPEKLFGGDPGVDRDTSGGDSESDEAGIETFQGVLLSVIPPHIPSSTDSVDIELGVLYLGNNQEWVRVSFWGDAAERVTEFIDVPSNTTVEVEGIVSDNDNEVTDFFIFEDMEQTDVTQIDKTITYTPDPIDTDSVEIESLVEMMTGEVVKSIHEQYENDQGETFSVQHLAVDSDGNKFAVELTGSHVDKTMRLGDTIYMFSGWGKDLDQFKHYDLPDYDYKGKFRIGNYSGIRNVSKTPLPSN
jgi:hypothetical protein